MGLAALTASSGKYGKRQAEIEREYQARQVAAAGVSDLGPEPVYSTEDNTIISLFGIRVALLIVFGSCVAGLWFQRRQFSKRTH